MLCPDSAYMVYQDKASKVGELTAYKQQFRSLLKRGVIKPNPKNAFLQDIGKCIGEWRKGTSYEVILMADMNEYSGAKGELYNFSLENDLIDFVSLLNHDLE